jgi:hypothetical protein
MSADAFARAVAGRHAAASGHSRRPALVLLASRRPMTPRRASAARHEHLHRSLRVSVKVHHATFVDRRSSVVRQELAAGPAFLERIIPRRTPTRPIMVAPVIQAISQPARVAAQVSDVPRVMRDRAPATEFAFAPSAPRDDIKPIRPWINASPPPTSPTLPSSELQRVTDHVLRSLDRQMSSWRDRRGRS